MEKIIDTSYTQNRELSWLRFNERVLEEATDERVPLYERLKFVAIYGSNLDEFYRVRVGSLCEMASIDTHQFDNKSFMTPTEQLEKIFAATKKLNAKADKILISLLRQLKTAGIEQMKVANLNERDKEATLSDKGANFSPNSSDKNEKEFQIRELIFVADLC